jgi:hypothetical protein
MPIKSFYTQQHCYVSLKNLIPWRDSNPGLLDPEADAMSTAPRSQVIESNFCRSKKSSFFFSPKRLSGRALAANGQLYY